MIYLKYTELVHVTERAMGEAPIVRDAGLLEAAAARPRTTVFGQDAYSTLEEKAAALAQSIAGNHALVDGNKRLTLGALIAFLGVNGRRLALTNEEAYNLVIAIATGELSEVPEIAECIRSGSEDWRRRRPGGDDLAHRQAHARSPRCDAAKAMASRGS